MRDPSYKVLKVGCCRLCSWADAYSDDLDQFYCTWDENGNLIYPLSVFSKATMDQRIARLDEIDKFKEENKVDQLGTCDHFDLVEIDS